MAGFTPSGVVTLTTDFGLEDPFVGVMKGRVLAGFPEARIVDVTHAIPPQRPAEAGFWLSRCFEYFPSGTVHVAVVDPGVGTARGIACVLARGHALLAPDNGLLAPIVSRCADAEIFAVSAAGLAALGIREVSATFHGRDIFAPVAAAIASGRSLPSDLGERRPALAVSGRPDATDASRDTVGGSVATIDHFGNLITDIEAQRLASLRDPRVSIAGRTLALHRTYGEARSGELLALVNSFGVLEIAQTDGSAAATLGVGRGTPVLVRASDPIGGGAGLA